MKLVCLRILGVLLKDGFSSVSSLAEKTGFAVSGISVAVKELEAKGLIERKNRVVSFALNPAANELRAVAGKFNLEKILEDKKEQVALALAFDSKTLPELGSSINLSEVQVSRILKELMESGAVFRQENKFELNESIKKFVLEWKKLLGSKQAEPNATVIFSNKFLLKKTPLNLNAKGSLTGFSRFAEFGVQYASISDFFVEPEHDVSIEEIFIHALTASESKKDIALCVIFYEKNRDSMNQQKLAELALEFKVLGLFLDCIAFLEKRNIILKDKFLPFNEFLELGRNYGIKARSKEKFSAKELEELFIEIGNQLNEALSVYLIGGCNMALQGIKAATKDIDLVVKNSEDFQALAKALKKIGFAQVLPKTAAYKKMNPNGIFEKKSKPRVDAFTKTICNALVLSNEMIEHSMEKKYGLLSVNFLKPEDIILFKAITDREGDLEDIAVIIRNQNPDWNFFLKELGRQHEYSERLFCLNVLDSIELIQEKEKIKIPAIRKIVNLCLEKSILFLAQEPRTIKELVEKINFPETIIRNKIAQLIKKNKIKKTNEKPFKIKKTG